MDEKVIFNYGCLGDSLEEQANQQGYTLGKNADVCEKIRKSINMCGFHVATESQVNSMFKKLQSKVVKSLSELVWKDKD